MKSFLRLFVAFFLFYLSANAQCTISTSVNASSLTCGTTPLISCNGILNIGNGTTPITLTMNTALDLSCLGTIQVIINNATLNFQPGNNRLTLAEGSSLSFVNGGTISDVSCNASERVYIGNNLLASCNGGGGADVTFSELVSQGGTGSVTSNSPVCQGNSIAFSAIAPPSNGPYTFAWSGPGLSLTSYSTTSTFSLTATNSNAGVYTVKMKSNTGVVSEAVVTVIINTGATTVTPIVSITQPTCTVSTGAITISSPSGTGMTYSTNGLNYTNTTGVFSSMSPGIYGVTAKNSSGCISSATIITVNSLTNTWNGLSWSSGFPPTSGQKIVFSNTFSSTSNLTGCSCQVSSANVIINSGHTLLVTDEIKITGVGTLIFEDGASLVQINDTAVNSGNIIYKRKTTALRQYDYTYWSSPVVSSSLSQLATNSLFYSFNPTSNLYVYQYGTTIMTQGVGYLGRAPSSLLYSPTQIVQTSFVGIPTNGVITTPIIKSTGTYNLIGNPYPSAIDADLFIGANSAVTNGTVYFWSHNTAITNNVYTANDYAKYNYTGSVGTSNPAISGGVAPTGKIAAGQGFFIEAKTSLANGTYSATFNNAMRIAGNNSQFFRNATLGTSSNSVSGNLERHRVWLSLRSSLGAYNQMLLGYIQGATSDFDSLFDGKTVAAGNTVSLYTMLGSDNFAIQGKSLPFSETDFIPLGYSTTINGKLSINLDNFDGLFTNQNVYLLDKTTNTFHNLKESPYNFVTTNGNFRERFELRFVNQTLGTIIPTITDTDVKIITTNQQLEVISPAMAISKIEIYDILGKLLLTQKELNSNLFKTNLSQLAPQMVLLKITFYNQQSLTKKALIQL